MDANDAGFKISFRRKEMYSRFFGIKDHQASKEEHQAANLKQWPNYGITLSLKKNLSQKVTL